jgi:hypothetical protein
MSDVAQCVLQQMGVVGALFCGADSITKARQMSGSVGSIVDFSKA